MQTLKVAILWHMHQPSYWDSQLGKYRYPWAFLHGARHYHMMAHLAALHPEMRLTFNLTPVLLDQLEHYAGERIHDVLLDTVLKPAADLLEEEVRRFLEHVFKLNAATMIDPFPRYRELRNLLGSQINLGKLKKLKPREILDLQTLYLLTWCGAPLRDREPVKELLKKERDFSEDEKRAVFAAAQGALREIIPLYRKLQEEELAEISTTPYFHPILPLIIDCEAARQARSNVHLDEISFAYRGDAEWQVAAAVEAYQKRFGRSPAGMWPAEGGVSDEALFLMADHGIQWAASDESVLARSLNRGQSGVDKYRPFRLGERIVLYFRDRGLSDRIGFIYSSWDPVQAADDLVGRCLGIRDHLGGGADDKCITIILDGENPWEHYPDGGIGFLARLYGRLSETPGLKPVRFCDHLQEAKCENLKHVVPGSWIDGNFDTWIGSPEKNHAWKVLGAARRKLAMEAPQAEVPLEFYRAEGSDWFWWLGPGHDTPYEQSYENLFRLNLQKGLARVGLEEPPILHTAAPIAPSPSFQPPMHLFTPRINGQMGSYYDWIAAGFYLSSEGSFHRSNRPLQRLRFGFDATNLYLRLEGDLQELRKRGEGKVCVEIQKPRPLRVLLSGGELMLQNELEEWEPLPGQGAVGAVVELGLPLEALGLKSGDDLEFAVGLQLERETLDRIPQFGYVTIRIPPAEYGEENWSV